MKPDSTKLNTVVASMCGIGAFFLWYWVLGPEFGDYRFWGALLMGGIFFAAGVADDSI